MLCKKGRANIIEKKVKKADFFKACFEYDKYKIIMLWSLLLFKLKILAVKCTEKWMCLLF